MLVIQDLLKLVVDKRASDLHLTAGRPPQLRIDGELVTTDLEIVTPEAGRDLAYSILTEEQIETFEKKKELDLSYGMKGISRFRVNVYRQRGSVAIAVRHIPFVIPSMEELGLPEIVKEFADRPTCLVLVTGPTGCGKSTTLASMIEYINNKKRVHVVTIEDPIEYLYQHKKGTINQREIGTDTLSFTEALRHVVRQDPNVVMIGEMRDLETIGSALTLAETGHLVLATLHTSDATHAVSRIVDVFPPYQQQQVRVQLSMVLTGVMAQRLLPHRSGKGRVLACEVMNVIDSIQNLIRENNIHQIYSVIQTGKKYGMWTMNQSLADLVKRGFITVDEAMKRSQDLEELNSLLAKA